jgi:hypothetical protein
MKLVEFKYKKADGSESERAVIELQVPSKHFEGIDVSELPEADFALFVQEFRELKNAQHEATMALLAKHDLKHNYRRFLPEQMAEVTSEHI